jgi:hypothetical protein
MILHNPSSPNLYNSSSYRINLFELEDSLAKVLALEHTDETLSSVVNTLGNVKLGLDTAVGEPLLEILLVILVVGRAEIGVRNEETLHLDLLGDEVEQTLDTLALVGGGVVLGDLKFVSYVILKKGAELAYQTADRDTATNVDVGKSSLEVLTTDVLEVNIDTVGGETRKSILRALLLVVEASIETKLLGDEVKLSIVANGTNNSQTLTLGNLANDLTNSTSSRANEDSLALLGLTNLVKTRPGGETRHTQRTEEKTKVKVMRVLDLSQVNLGNGVLLNTDIFGDGEVAGNEVALGKVRSVALDDLAKSAVDDGVVDLKGGSV